MAWALRYGRRKVARALIAKGACLDRRAWLRGYGALRMAAELGDAEIVGDLLRKGANVNVTSGCGATPLHVASVHGRTAIALALLEAGANASVRTSCSGECPGGCCVVVPAGVTPLRLAVLRNHRATADVLRSCDDR